MADIGTRLREERINLKMSQTEFGRVGGVQKNAQSYYEKPSSDDKHRSPDAEYLAKLAKLGVDIQYVLTGSHKAESDNQVAELLAAWSQLNEEHKDLLLSMAKALCK